MSDIEAIKAEVERYKSLRTAANIRSGDYIDMKVLEPAMRHLIDTYIKADEIRKISVLDDMWLVHLIVERSIDAVELLPPGLRESEQAVAKTIENNVRKLIIDEQPINPK